MNLLILAVVADGAIGIAGGIFFLAVVTIILLLQEIIIVDPIVQEMREVHDRRVARVRRALNLSGAADSHALPADPGHPFEGWVKLEPDGNIKIAGQTFGLHQDFQTVAQDKCNVPRAHVACAGQGTASILSHGQSFRVRFQHGQWDIEVLPTLNENQHQQIS